ncbi:MAG: hypothetical protein ACK4GD_11645 [Sphingomonadaceae bacterium]
MLIGCSEQSDPVEVPDTVSGADTQAMATSAKDGGSATRLSADDRAAILRAAGFAQRGGKWVASCDDSNRGSEFEYEAAISYTGDLTGDGSPEVIVDGQSSACFGNTGNSFDIVSKTGGAWKVVMEDVIGLAQVFPQSGGKLPLVEIGGPGSFCFPAYRWNGKAFDLSAFSVGGKVCEEIKLSKIGGLPIGYYANQQFCGAQLSEVCVGYLGEDRLVEAGSGDFAGMKPAGKNKFALTNSFPAEDGGPASRSTEVIEVTGPTGFRYLNNDYYFVQRDRVPKDARLLDLPHYRSDPRFSAVRSK